MSGVAFGTGLFISSSFQLLFRFAALTCVTSTTSASAILNSQMNVIGLRTDIARKPAKRFNIVECWTKCLIEIKTFISQKMFNKRHLTWVLNVLTLLKQPNVI